MKRISRLYRMYFFFCQDKCEIQKDSIKPGATVVIVDDLLATGGMYIILD